MILYNVSKEFFRTQVAILGIVRFFFVSIWQAKASRFIYGCKKKKEKNYTA